jgi:hypothetical protein
MAVSAAQAYDENDEVRQALEDLSLSNNVAPAGTGRTGQCEKMRTIIPARYYLYLVIDVDGPGAYPEAVDRYVAQVLRKYQLNGRATQYRIGVTNTILENEGTLAGDAGWLTETDEVRRVVRSAATECEPSSDWACEGTRDGLAAANRGLKRMTNETAPPPTSHRMLPPDERALAVAFISDEQPASLQTGSRTVDSYAEFFESQKTTFIQTIGPQSDCSEGKHLSNSYAEISPMFAHDYCTLLQSDISEEDIVRDPWGWLSGSWDPSSDYQLMGTPITPSLRVERNDATIPRSYGDGFQYFANDNSIAFFGEYSPKSLDPFDGPYFNVFRYYSWGDGAEE